MSKPKVLIVGWDAADWKVILPLLDKGEMPNLARFIEDGVMGDITTLQPILSPMLWNSIATGKLADAHGILGFTEVDPDTQMVRPVTSTSRKVKALWNILSQKGYRTHVINWFGGHPAEPINGICVSDAYGRGSPGEDAKWPLMAGTIHPLSEADLLAGLRVRPDEMDEELLCLFVPRAADVDQDTDRHLAVLAKLLAEAYTVHTCATHVMEHHPWDFMGVYYPTIDHFSHGFMNFHPPKVEWVEQRDYDLYHDVLNSGYRLHDMLLGRLLQLAGDDTTVILVSDHGFHSDHLRPREIPNVPAGPAAQHRPLGVFAMRGPGVKKDERVYGVSLLDIAPTVLSIYGLPIGRDMPGRPLLEAFEQGPKVETIPSWEAVEGEAGMHKGNISMSGDDADALLEQFVALGYIDKQEEDKKEAAGKCVREQKWNLARVYTSTGRYHLALPLLEEIHELDPERIDYAVALALCQISLGIADQAIATAAEITAKAPNSPAAKVILAGIEMGLGRKDAAMALIQEGAEGEVNSTDVPMNLSVLFMRSKQWDQAERELNRALSVDPHNAEAYQLLARLCLRMQRNEEAAAAALNAVAFRHDLPQAHLYLGIALFRLGRLDRAEQAFQTALSFPVPLRQAHWYLYRLYMRIAGRQREAVEQQQRAQAARRGLAEYRDRLSNLRHKVIQEAELRAAERAVRQAARLEAERLRAEQEPPRFVSEAEREKRSLEFVLVSGLPRSGTSLMMQMLNAGGLAVMEDGARTADLDNPRGYFEWEAIKQVHKKPEILYQAEGKVIKVISMLLQHLPVLHSYKVIFMERPIDEVVASQRKMIANRGEQAPKASPEQMRQNLARHRKVILGAMRKSKKFEPLVVDYPDLVSNPDAWIEKIASFLGPGHPLDRQAMVACIDPNLHRNRA